MRPHVIAESRPAGWTVTRIGLLSKEIGPGPKPESVGNYLVTLALCVSVNRVFGSHLARLTNPVRTVCLSQLETA